MIRAISHPVCPFLHRRALSASVRGDSVRVEFVDLFDRPPWFRQMSPDGRMPVYVDGDSVRFGPEDPGESWAATDAWVDRAEALLGWIKAIYTAGADGLGEAVDALFVGLATLEGSEVDTTVADRLSDLDILFAPGFTLLAAHPRLWADPRWRQLPRTRAWAEVLVAHPQVLATRHPAHAAELERFIDGVGGAIGTP